MNSDQYDSIALSYQKSIVHEKYMKFCCDPSFLKAIGNPEGLKVLDYGCGEGYFSRLMRSAGASKVVGFDISEEMIKLAKAKERQENQNIEYLVSNAVDLPILGEFDLCISKFVLHYAKSKQELRMMALSAYKNLKKGGRFLVMVPSFNRYLPNDNRYDFMASPDKLPLSDGSNIHVTLYSNGSESCSFDTYFWLPQTYVDYLSSVGFNYVKELPIVISEEGIKLYSKPFWQELIDGKPFVLFEGIK